MSIQSAMQAGVSGLGAQSRKFATISDNISNSETIGYKRTQASFVSQVVEGGSRTTYSAGGVGTAIERRIDRAGTLRGSERPTDLAINGGGFFLVKGGLPDAQANEPLLLTRVGNSNLDQDGYLRLSNGYYLQGMPLDADGLPATSIPGSIRIERGSSDPVPSTSVTFQTNLPADEADEATEGAPRSTGVAYVDELGADRSLNFVWTPAAGGVPNRWNLKIYDVNPDGTVPATPVAVGTYDDDADPLTPEVPDTRGVTVDFDVTGPNAGRPTALSPTSFAIAGSNGMPLQVDLRLSQFAYDYNPLPGTDGVPVSDFASVEVGEDGTVFTVFKNGFREAQYRLVMGEVTNPDGLRPTASNAYAVAIDSGDLVTRFPGEGAVGTVLPFSLEGSNVDIAEELTQMITTQRAYSANASIITTSDEMLEEVVRLKR